LGPTVPTRAEARISGATSWAARRGRSRHDPAPHGHDVIPLRNGHDTVPLRRRSRHGRRARRSALARFPHRCTAPAPRGGPVDARTTEVALDPAPEPGSGTGTDRRRTARPLVVLAVVLAAALLAVVVLALQRISSP